MRRRGNCRHSSIAPNFSSEPSITEGVLIDQPLANLNHDTATRHLWNEAYTDHRKCNKVLVDRFEKIILSEDPEEQEGKSRRSY